VTVENVSLAQGRKLFDGKPVMGGFDSRKEGVLYKGSKAEIETETARIIREAGTIGTIIGADCTIPQDINIDHLRWVKVAAATSW
jgi:uroporphyrinogen decarboxylase